jgi:Phage integrase family
VRKRARTTLRGRHRTHCARDRPVPSHSANQCHLPMQFTVAHDALSGFAESMPRKQESSSGRNLWCRSVPFPSATHIATCVRVSLSRHPKSTRCGRPRRIGRRGKRNGTMILLAYRHGLRVAALMYLRWDQVDLAQGLLHVRRLKHGVPSTHPLTGTAMRALRKLKRLAGDAAMCFSPSVRGH